MLHIWLVVRPSLTYIYIYIYTSICVYIYIYIYISIYLSIYLSISLSLSIYIYIYIYTHTYTQAARSRPARHLVTFYCFFCPLQVLEYHPGVPRWWDLEFRLKRLIGETKHYIFTDIIFIEPYIYIYIYIYLLNKPWHMDIYCLKITLNTETPGHWNDWSGATSVSAMSSSPACFKSRASNMRRELADS